MNPAENPFVPGAGTQPPELAGRSGVLIDADVAFARARQGRGRSMLLLGLRGVGKTALLNKLSSMAHQGGCLPVVLEAPEDRSLAASLVPELRSTLFHLSTSARAADQAKKGLAALRGFAGAFKVKVGDVEFGVGAAPGVADSGDLDHDLARLLEVITEAAKAEGKGVALLIDEVQYLNQTDLSALIVATHKLSQKALPFVVIGAGLPMLAGLAGNAKSYAERLFDYPEIGPLPAIAAREAIVAPLNKLGIAIDDDALDAIIEHTHGYPYFLQEWAFQTWNAAPSSPITLADVKLASRAAVSRLDSSFFKVRRDRLTPKELEYLSTMAQLGPGPHNTGDVAAALKKKPSAFGPLRDGLIKKGMIFSPRHGLIAFTVPLFDDYLKRQQALQPLGR